MTWQRDNAETFRLEMSMDRVELGLFQSLQKDPNDKASRAAYVDYLIEKGRLASAEAVRDGHVPGMC